MTIEYKFKRSCLRITERIWLRAFSTLPKSFAIAQDFRYPPTVRRHQKEI